MLAHRAAPGHTEYDLVVYLVLAVEVIWQVLPDHLAVGAELDQLKLDVVVWVRLQVPFSRCSGYYNSQSPSLRFFRGTARWVSHSPSDLQLPTIAGI
jgi:hypothetical protein